MSQTANMIAIRLSFFGPIPDLVRDRIVPELDRLGVDISGMIHSATWLHQLDSTHDYPLDYWDRGFAALLERLGGADSIIALAEQARPSPHRTIRFHRESMTPDEVEGDGPFSYPSDYATICLSDRTVSQIGALGFGIYVTHRIKPPHEQSTPAPTTSV